MKKVNVEQWHLVASIKTGQWQIAEFEHRLEVFDVCKENRVIAFIRSISTAKKGTFKNFPHPTFVADITFVGKDFTLWKEENVPFCSTDEESMDKTIKSLSGGSLLYVRPEVDLKNELTNIMKGLLK